jgi:hypothetical protein
VGRPAPRGVALLPPPPMSDALPPFTFEPWSWSARPSRCAAGGTKKETEFWRRSYSCVVLLSTADVWAFAQHLLERLGRNIEMGQRVAKGPNQQIGALWEPPPLIPLL